MHVTGLKSVSTSSKRLKTGFVLMFSLLLAMPTAAMGSTLYQAGSVPREACSRHEQQQQQKEHQAAAGAAKQQH
jgi:Na+-transporting methylmalonyl-CoA/oxaloacetate decarboxylase gamma subunit